MRNRLWVGLVVFMACPLGAAAVTGTLQDIRERGALRIGVYNDHAPFSSDGHGIDVDIARALGEMIGLPVEIAGFDGGDTVDDDLRNILWKGHYLRKDYTVDVMMHVPVDAMLARRNDQVRILAPYVREQLVVARNRNRIPSLVTLAVFRDEKVGVQWDTLEDHYLSTAFGGSLRQNVVHYATIADAAAALGRNEIAAVMGRRTHVEAGLSDAARNFEVGPVALPGISVSGWDIGVAVKADHPELAAAVDTAMAKIRGDGVVERIYARRGLTYAAPHGTGN